VELFAIQKIDDLCEDRATSVHSLLRTNTHYFGQRVQMRDTCFWFFDISSGSLQKELRTR
jgi:hypothetical protein